MYDAIVVGAGPAGSTAAMVLAQNGMRTLLVDRETFPREKACGDAVPTSCFKILRSLGVAPFSGDDLYPVDRIFVKGPHGASLHLPLHEKEVPPGIVSRYVFDRVLFDHAVACGAEFCQISVSAPIIEDGKVVGIKAKDVKSKQNVEFRGKVVIAADGATSAIARTLGGSQRSEKNTAVALRGYIETDVDLDNTIDLVFLNEVQPGYAWFFPMSKRAANIGVGMRSDVYKHQDRTLQDMLDLYLKSPEVRSRVGDHKVTDIKSWQVPLNLFDQKRVFDGAILAGDAGGFVDPLTGAGIYQAVVTGKHAAEAAVQAIKTNDVSANGLALYDELWRRDLGEEIKRSSLTYKLASWMPGLIDGVLFLGHSVPQIMPLFIGKV